MKRDLPANRPRARRRDCSRPAVGTASIRQRLDRLSGQLGWSEPRELFPQPGLRPRLSALPCALGRWSTMSEMSPPANAKIPGDRVPGRGRPLFGSLPRKDGETAAPA